MSGPSGARLIQACESLCDELRRSVGLTAFTIELARSPTPLVISLRTHDAPPDPRHDWMLPPVPARIEVVLSDGDRRVATVRIEDARRAEYPEQARATCERIATRFVPELGTLLASTA